MAAGGDGRRWLAAAPPDLRAKVVQKILIKLRNAGKNAGLQLLSPQVVHISTATSPLIVIQQQENSHHLATEEAVDDEVRRDAEAPVAINLTGGSTVPFTGGSGTCSQEKQQEHHPAYEAIPQLTQNANPVETPPAQQQTKRSLSPAELRSLAREMGVNLKRAFRHMRTPAGSMDDGDCMWIDEPSSGESCNKRRKTLQDEITAAYSMLVETEIRITDDDDTRGADGAVVIELCYIPVSLTPDLMAVIDPCEMSTKLLVRCFLETTTDIGRPGLQLACWTWSSDVPSASSRSPGQWRG
ncbi:hypothetical protein ZWY2020_015400 [Hordeum vulgare]|nr:hypothetical protein ZWY2020_015400 [Hordeum vulgare]